MREGGRQKRSGGQKAHGWTYIIMKVLHVITGLDVGGAETMLYRLATHMDVVRFQPRVVSLIEPGAMGKKLADAGIRVNTLGMQRGIPSPAGLFRLVKLIRSWRPDIVQTWLYHADLAGLIATRLAFPLGGGPKVAWNIRCSYMALEEYRRLTGTTLKACAKLSRFPDVVLTNSHEARRFHMELGYNPKQFTVIPNGFNIDRFKTDGEARREVREELSIDRNSIVIGHVARFDAMKDHHTFIRAAAQTAREVKNTIFVLSGRGVDLDNTELASWITEAGLDLERVRLLGERRDMPRLMAAMDIHVSSSVGESFPNVVGETMACGVPNIVTNVGDSDRLVGDTGITVPPEDAVALADAIILLSKLPDAERKQKGYSARNRVVEKFSLSMAVNTFSTLYEKLHDAT